MTQRPKKPFISPERHTTIRQAIIGLLEGETLTARDISAGVHIPEKDVYDHLEHIKKSKPKELEVTPAECRACGFVFHKRERLKKPGRCPICHKESIEAPQFSIHSAKK